MRDEEAVLGAGRRAPRADARAGARAQPFQTSVKKITVNFNTNEWTLMPKREGEASNKRMFQHRSLPIYSMVIADELPASNESLKSAIFSNAASGGFTTTTLIDQSKQISGHQVGELRFAAANKSGMEFVFSSYYYADEDDNVQLMCYTAQSLFHKYQAECEKLLNGLAIK